MNEDLVDMLKVVIAKMREEGISRTHTIVEDGDSKYTIGFSKVRTPTIPTEGICSRILGELADVLFIDYDKTNLDILYDEATALQEFYRCGKFYVFQTREESYHMVCLDYFRKPEVRQALFMTSCDYAFRNGPLYNFTRSWVLRFTPKGDRPAPKYIDSIASPYDGERMQSSFHAEFLNRIYNIGIILANPDGKDTGYIDKYLSSVKEAK